ncbi:LysM peptidoglycan-binding domain-containing protein [Streptomyces netropsis]|uniref:LysM peptidoglycan-binding domain-containing protein n=1 Tax=Streptomyces netropsis TaxID=55404 RepID=UPI0030CA6030
MPIVVVEQENTVAALAARLVKAGTSKAAQERAAQAIREANPGLDLDHLRPGMVVVVPPLVEARDEVPDVVEGALAAFFEQISRELDALIQTARSALEADKAERQATAEVLAAEKVQAAAQNDPMLRNNLEQVRQTLADDGQIAVEITESLITGTEQWFTDLDDLSTLW